MACVKSVKKVIESVRGTVNPYYDMGCDNVNEIYRTNSNVFDMICDAFVFGYAQGIKSAKAEIRKAAE